VFLAGHTIAMVTYCVTKMTTTCSPMIGHYSDTMVVASSDNEWLNDPSKSNCWKLFWATLSGHYPFLRGWPFNRCWISSYSHTWVFPHTTLSTRLNGCYVIRCYLNMTDFWLIEHQRIRKIRLLLFPPPQNTSIMPQ